VIDIAHLHGCWLGHSLQPADGRDLRVLPAIFKCKEEDTVRFVGKQEKMGKIGYAIAWCLASAFGLAVELSVRFDDPANHDRS
jgi:hypothetical protein